MSLHQGECLIDSVKLCAEVHFWPKCQMDLAYFQSYDCVCDFITSIREPKETISSPLAVTITPLDSGGGKDCNLHLRLPVLQPPSCLHPSLHPSAVASPTIFATCFFKCASLAHSFDPHGAGLELWRRWSLSFFFFGKLLNCFAQMFFFLAAQSFTQFLSLALKCWHMFMLVCVFVYLRERNLNFPKILYYLKTFSWSIYAVLVIMAARRQKPFSR